MTGMRVGVRCAQALAAAVWAVAYLDVDGFGLAGTVAGSSLLLIWSTEVAYRVVRRP